MGSFVDGVPERDAWPHGVLHELEKFLQGDVVQAPEFVFYGAPGAPVNAVSVQYATVHTDDMVMIVPEELSPPLAIITTATCDVAEPDVKNPNRPFVQVAPVVNMADMPGDSKGNVRANKVGYFFHLPALAKDEGDLWVADLRYDQPVEKSWLARQERIEALVSEDERNRFGRALAWQRERPAMGRRFIDLVQRPLHEALEKLRKGDKPLFALIDEEAEEWAVRLASRLDPEWVEIVLLSSGQMSEPAREWWQLAVNDLREGAETQGLSILGPRFEDLEQLCVNGFRRLTVLGSPHRKLSTG
ncbi:hypothetical protein ACQEVG_38170 [Streptomyces sp. CA-135486]|uniref:hypothetical protein n=1 Tax=Streptomyces sp. CA-135486 TaxID=3240049 RepID=UPI003D8DC0E2